MSKKNVKKYNIFHKFCFVWRLLSINPILSYCNYCHSYAIKATDSKNLDADTFAGTYYCRTCGATMTLVEKWHKEGEFANADKSTKD